MLHESRADALEQLHASQAKARENEKQQMSYLMGELKAWKSQNEQRMHELSTRTAESLSHRPAAPRSPRNASPPPKYGGSTTTSAYGGDSLNGSPRKSNGNAHSNHHGYANGGDYQQRLAAQAAAAERPHLRRRLDQLRNGPPPTEREPPPSAASTSLRTPMPTYPPSPTASVPMSSSRAPPRPEDTSLRLPRNDAPASSASARLSRGVPAGSTALSGRSRLAAPAEEGRSLRALQKELDSLKSSLSVYLGSGLL